MCNMQMHPRRTVRIENGDFYLEQGNFKFPFSPPVYEPKTESSGWNEDDTVKAYNAMYYVDTEDVENKTERKKTVRKNINSTIDPRKI